MRSLFLTTFLLNALVLQAQYDSLLTIKSKNKNAWRHGLAIPALFVGAGVYVMTDNDVIDRYEVREERNEHFSSFRVHIDDYMQYAPIAGVCAKCLRYKREA